MVACQFGYHFRVLEAILHGVGIFASLAGTCPTLRAQPGPRPMEVEKKVLGNMGLEEARQLLNRSLNAQINELDIQCRLTTTQEQKLMLAGAGDIHRFFQQIEELKRVYLDGPIAGVRQSLNLMVRPLRLRFTSGLHNHASLFRRSFTNTRNGEQLAIYCRWIEATRKRRHASAISQVTTVVARKAALSKEASAKLHALLLKEIPYAQFKVVTTSFMPSSWPQRYWRIGPS
jgi:hypothetical protein